MEKLKLLLMLPEKLALNSKKGENTNEAYNS